ncbi:MAG: LPS export ABC transporter periplasmic protein LptC [Bdellovibrionota bacterium]|nr:MAG: LPS export ABC transporter periplasmic protein LptC [Bdellovibrionota bacterium]
MHITKQQSIAGAVLVLVAAIGLLILATRVPQQRTEQAPRTPIQEEQSAAASAHSAPGQIVLDNFHRTETRNGSPIWEVKASKGVLNPSTNEALLDQAEVTLSRKKEQPTFIQADHAKVLIQGATLTSAEAWGNVVVKQRDMELHSDRALYDLASEQVDVPGAVEIQNSLLQIKGVGLKGDLASQVFHLQRDVETTIHNDRQK